MKQRALIIAILLSITFTIGCFAQMQADTNVKKDSKTKLTKRNKKVEKQINLEVLAKGNYSGIEEAFIFVAKNKDDLSSLTGLIDNLEIKKKVDFEKNVVIAAFAGGHRTGGFSVEFEETEQSLFINLNSPPKDAMVTQALTQPFKIVSVPLEKWKTKKIEFSKTWKRKAQVYEVKEGTFEFSGGIAGIRKEFDTEGTVTVFRLNKFATVILNLKGTGKEKERTFYEVMSGKVKDDILIFNDLNGGSFIDSPHPPLKAMTTLYDKKLVISFSTENEKFPVSDGFEGRGSLEAYKTD